jgi:hypothetical protein
MAFEQAPVKAKKSGDFARVDLARSGDEGVDASLIEHYESLGYRHVSQSKTGRVTMEIPRERALEIEQNAIKEHYRRVEGTKRAEVGPDVKLVEDKTEVLSPKSPEDFIGQMGLTSEE